MSLELENINAGEYYIYCDVSWDLSSSQLPKKQISLNCYCEGGVDFSEDLAGKYC